MTRKRKWLLVIGILAFLGICIASGDKRRMAYLCNNLAVKIKSILP